MSEKPVWRWWLFCVALRCRWYDLMSWCVLPEWLGWDGEPLPSDAPGEEVPF